MDLDDKKLDYFFDRTRGAGWGAGQPNNAYLSLSRPLRMVPGLFTTEKRDNIWKSRQDILVHQSCDRAANPILRNYEILEPNKLDGFATRIRPNIEGYEKKLQDSPKWNRVDPVGCFNDTSL